MNASVLLLPFLLIRFGLFAYISRDAMGRAAHFPPWRARRPSPTIFIRRPRWAYSFARFFCGYSPRPYLFRRNCPVWPGRDPFAMDDSVFFPSRPGRAQCQRDLPALPQPHVCGLLPLFPGHGPADPPPLFLCLVLAFQVAAHWIILAEERECLERFGDAYRQYMKRTRRYF